MLPISNTIQKSLELLHYAGSETNEEKVQRTEVKVIKAWGGVWMIDVG